MTAPDIHEARLYLCTDARKERGDFADFVDAAFAGGVDIIQLRDKNIEAAEELELLAVLRQAAARHGRLWAVNDRADIASLAGAPVFHIGQKDLPLHSARTLLNDSAAIGLSTHSPDQVDAAIAAAQAPQGLDYFCVGPVWATPTKPGRAAVGLDLVRYAAGAVGSADEESGPAVFPGSPSAGLTWPTSSRWWRREPAGSSWCGPSPRLRTLRLPRPNCSQRLTRGHRARAPVPAAQRRLGG